MALPLQLKAKYLDRLQSLIAEGQPIAKDLQIIRSGGDGMHTQKYVEWGSKCASVLMQILPKNHPRYAAIASFGNTHGCVPNSPDQVAILRAVRDDLEHGFLDKLSDKIEAEFAADYMGQAEQLLKEGQSGKFDHVPAAVLIGAVLEKSLRTLCSRQTPPISTTKPDGKPMTLDPLIVALKKADVIKQTMAAQLSAWAHIRNKAAHGEFDQFTRHDVETMVSGVQSFIALHL
jgi:hypothetical protein